MTSCRQVASMPQTLNKETQLDEFLRNLHPSTKVLSRGKATVLGNTVPAVLVRTLYGQEIVWGEFNCDRGKFKGKRLTNDAATEEVIYVPEAS